MQHAIPWGKISIVVLLAVAIVGVVASKRMRAPQPVGTPVAQQPATTPDTVPAPSTPPTPPIGERQLPSTTLPADKQAPAPSARAAKPSVTASPKPPVLVKAKPPVSPAGARPATTPAARATAPAVAATPATLPRFVELGSDKCIPCKMMQPVLEQLRKDHGQQLNVEFIDVWKDEAAAKSYNVQSIPTQVIFGSNGQEIFRHTGYWPIEDAVSKLQELGVLE